jgi:hypothetical protein
MEYAEVKKKADGWVLVFAVIRTPEIHKTNPS